MTSGNRKAGLADGRPPNARPAASASRRLKAPIYVFLNGHFEPPPDLPSAAPETAFVTAVDGGARRCLELGWRTDLLLGDFDSLTPAELTRVQAANPRLELEIHPRDKDETDFELALRSLRRRRPDGPDLEVLGGLGGRWDMSLSNLLLPLAAQLQPSSGRRQTVVFRQALSSIWALNGPTRLSFPPQAGPALRRVSLLPLTPAAEGLTLTGDFRWPLTGETLLFGLTRGLSNELGPQGGVLELTAGALLAFVSPLDDVSPWDGQSGPPEKDARPPEKSAGPPVAARDAPGQPKRRTSR
ncbi:MAG: thiamine diphosphokinase, partial [Deltaproteobacteria bacterium]|nr:thiamine diphosphokinase [Deltaproteobacteria bacterium]